MLSHRRGLQMNLILDTKTCEDNMSEMAVIELNMKKFKLDEAIHTSNSYRNFI